MNSFATKYYEQDEFWYPNKTRAEDTARIKAIESLIPDEIFTLLDVGCGNGLLLSRLANNSRWKRLCGVDASSSALAHVTTEKYQQDISELRFGDGEFDIVTCLEVLEHIPYVQFPAALRQISRIARHYVVISVPFNEDIIIRHVTCPICMTRFNKNLHLRRFDEPTVLSLFGTHGWKCIDVNYLNRTVSHYLGLDWYRRLLRMRSVKKAFPASVICPCCGYQKESQIAASARKDSASRGQVKEVVKSLWPKRYTYSWIVALYAKS